MAFKVKQTINPTLHSMLRAAKNGTLQKMGLARQLFSQEK
jgi:hypothetical protein